jgi:hypothetical protein
MDLVAGNIPGILYCGLNGGRHSFEMPRVVSALNGGRDRAALLVPKDHNQLRMKVFDRILDAGQFIVMDYVPGDADDKQVAQTLVEY